MEREISRLRSKLNIPNGGDQVSQHSRQTTDSSVVSNKENLANEEIKESNDEYEDPLIREFMRDAKKSDNGVTNGVSSNSISSNATSRPKAGSALAAASGMSQDVNSGEYCDDCVSKRCIMKPSV